MRRMLCGAGVVLCLSLPILSGCASTPTRESAGEFVDDSVVTTKVKAELAKDEILSLFVIQVETYRGVVQLSGFVDKSEQAEKAAAIARKVTGVREVKNSLIVKPR